MSQSLCPLIKLSNGVELPQLGMGLWEATDDEAVQNVHWAVKAGYRHLDTAYFYKNEESVGRAIKTCGIPREELFVTTKLWNADHGYDQTLAAFERSLKLLGLEYLDLYLIHWPGPNPQSYLDTWRAMEKLYEDKKVRAIGVSNFEPHHIDDILKVCKVAPMVNQIEMHPLNQQEAVRAYCHQKGIAVTAWRPLGKGALLSDPVIGSVAEKYGRSPAQVILRWMIQLGVVTIPKSSNERRIQQNFTIFDFQLEPSDMDRIRQLNKDSRFGGHPDSFFPTE